MKKKGNVIGSMRSGQEGKSNHWTYAGRHRARPNSWGGIFPNSGTHPRTRPETSGLEPTSGILKPGDVGGLHYRTHRPRQVVFVLQRSSTSSHGSLAIPGTKAFWPNGDGVFKDDQDVFNI